MGRVRMLLHFGVVPYLVFDGDYLPSKAATEHERTQKRAESRKTGLQLYKMGKTAEATSELQKAVDVTPEMARQMIDELKKLNIDFVVAPYEADAQLVYLEKTGVIQGIISEDSDLLVFGSKLLLTKLDQYGECVSIRREDFTACRDVSLAGWTDADFRHMAILGGCDYLANIRKMGLKKAHALVKRYKTIEQIIRMVYFDGKYQVPPSYLEDFRRAELTFLHQRVFSPSTQQLVMFSDLGTETPPEDFDFIGKDIEPSIAAGVARGDLHPMTKEPIQSVVLPSSSSRSRNSLPRSKSDLYTSTPNNNKPIQQFFKAKRTPLAELDPNVFTPSPSQQRLLEQQNGSWHGTLVNENELSRPSTSSTPVIRSTNAAHAQQALQSRTNSITSGAHATKRQRLCDDQKDERATSFNELHGGGRSRFFASSVPDPSPSVGKKFRRQVNSTEVHIWSDDSLEEAMANMPDVYSTELDAERNDKSPALQDLDIRTAAPGEQSGGGAEVARTSSAAIAAIKPLLAATNGVPTDTIVTSEPKPLAGRLDTQVRRELDELAEKFSYKPTPPSLTRSTSSADRRPAGAEPGRPTLPVITPAAMRTPLQRLKAGALRRSKSLCESFVSKPTVLNVSETSRDAKTSELKLQARGSEDLLVPDSEEDDGSGSEGETKRASIIDLERFRCRGPD